MVHQLRGGILQSTGFKMPEQTLKRHIPRLTIGAIFIGLLATAAPRIDGWEENNSRLVWLFRLEGAFSEELPIETGSDDKIENPGFILREARLEADNGGSFTRLRALLTIANNAPRRRITDVEWRLDVYDASLRSVSARVVQKDKLNIYPGESAVASARMGAVLPDRMVVLLQITRVAFADGPAWLVAKECSLGEDLRTVTCKSK